MQKWQKMRNNLLPISNNGFKYIAYALVASILFKILDFDTLAFVFFMLMFAIVYFFRNPEREVTIFDEGSVVSPLDGKVISIDEMVESEYGYKIIVENNYLDIGVLRAPCDSFIESVSKKSGTRLSFKSKTSEDLNEHIELVFKQGKFNKIKVKHILTQSFSPIDITILKDKNIRQSARYGFMLHGFSEIYIPKNFRLNINKGDNLTASETLLGFFIAIP
jgi:phosphatidylserine decarboxylase